MPKAQTNFVKISDEAVRARTGKRWSEWFTILDRFKVEEDGHKLAAKYLHEKYKLSPWWSQAVTIHYEWERGLRIVKDQRKTMPKHPLFAPRKKKQSSR
jgi:hypothetical protein